MSRHHHSEFVCGSCFSDEGLQAFCAQHAESEECDFCGATHTEAIAAPLDDVIEHISACVHNHYDDPANAGLPYESAEGGYQGPLYETYEVFEALGLEFPRDEDGKLQAAIENGLENDLWTDTDPFGLSDDEKLHFSWNSFCRLIKHERRFFFLDQGETPTLGSGDELFGPAEILKVIFSFAESEGAFVELPAGTHLYRARHQPSGKRYATAGTLGPPPLEHAIKTNRMSPPGIVMTYASQHCDTALAETADEPGIFAVGEFVTERAALILDLTRLPDVPSVFSELPDTNEYDPRPRLNFLHHVSREISKPIARDDRVHVEYVPTQVVTEYVRSAIQIKGRQVEGIRYASSRSSAQTALVLFADQANLVFEKGERPEFYHLGGDRWLRLLAASEIDVTCQDIARWAAKPRSTLFD
ncbi:MAG: HEPN-associated N-terminal domain-containing protein [Xanthobacteraceae bacterium]